MAGSTWGFKEAERRLREFARLAERNMNKASEGNAIKLRDAIKRTIRDGRPEWPALKQATIDRKGSSKPLIDKGDLMQSPDYAEVGSHGWFVGIPRNAKKKSGEGEKAELVNIAMAHEFGTGATSSRSGGSVVIIPPRPFIMPTFERMKVKLTAEYREAIIDALKGRRYARRG